MSVASGISKVSSDDHNGNSSYTGSPDDEIYRKKVVINKLDMKRDYSNTTGNGNFHQVKKAIASPAKPDRPWKRQSNKEPVINDISKVPTGWHMREDDLHICDIDGQIERCYDRINEGILPQLFEQRLKEYQTAKTTLDGEINGAPEELSFLAKLRLNNLKQMRIKMMERRYRVDQLTNINNLILAYSTGKLDWNPRFVTYWSGGEQICPPRPFDWDELEAMAEAHRAKNPNGEAFWVEGDLIGPGPFANAAMTTTAPLEMLTESKYHIYIALRIPGIPYWTELPFLFDTGAARMNIFRGDLATIMGPFDSSEHLPPVELGILRTMLGDGQVIENSVCELEATVLQSSSPGGSRQRLMPWIRLPVVVHEGLWNPLGPCRNSGRDIIGQLYWGLVPDNQFRTIASNTATGLQLPSIDLAQYPPPPSYRGFPTWPGSNTDSKMPYKNPPLLPGNQYAMLPRIMSPGP